MNKKLFCLIVYILTSFQLVSQNKQQLYIDSLITTIKLLPNDISRVKTLCAIANNYYYVNPNEGIKYATDALLLAKKIKYNYGIALAYGMISVNQNRTGNTSEALINIEKSIELTLKIKDENELCKRYITKANILLKISKYEDCINYYLKSEKINLKIKNSNNLMVIYSNIGIAYQELNDFEKAEDYYKKGLVIAKQVKNENNEILFILNLSTIYLERDLNTEKVLELLLPLEEKAINLGRIGTLITIYNNISAAYSQQKDYNKAIFFLSKELPLISTLNDPEKEANYYLTKAENIVDFINLNPIRNDLDSIINQALYHFDFAKVRFEKLNRKSKLLVIEKKKAALYELKEKFKEAYYAIKQFSAYQDSLFSEEKIEERTKLYLNYKFEKKTDSLKLRQQINQLKFKQKERFNLLKLKQKNALIQLKEAALKIAQYNFQIEHSKKINQRLRFNKLQNESNLKYTLLKRANFFQKYKNKIYKKQQLYFVIGLLLLLLLVVLSIKQIKSKAKHNQTLKILNHELEVSNDAKLNLLNMINHDFRAPISNLIHLLDLIAYDELSNNVKKELLQENQIKIQDLLNAMDDVLLWGKSQLKDFNPIKEFTPVNIIFDECLNYFSTYNNVKINYDNTISTQVYTDKELLKIIIRNLTLNAIQANNNNKNLEISWEVKLENNNCVFLISNNGIGISQQSFQELIQTINANAKKGYGLKIVTDLISKINGEIHFENTKKGVVFYVQMLQF